MSITQKIKKLSKMLSSCTLCPHRCRADRLSGEKGFCGAGKDMVISSAMPHHGEEPPISGTGGSGTIFFSHCNMGCCYCQNYQISQEHEGYTSSPRELAEKMLSMADCGVHNINLVSPTIWLPGILEALHRAAGYGLDIPIVYNTGGYEDPTVIRMLEGIVDIYMPDMRYSSNEYGEKYSSVKDYVKYNRKSIKEMYRQVGRLRINKHGIASKGLLVRLLVLPDDISGIKGTLDFLKDNLSTNISLSIMAQYHPCYKADDYPELSRRISPKEYSEVLEYAAKLGFKYGWTQDHAGLDASNDPFIPDFSKKEVFRRRGK